MDWQAAAERLEREIDFDRVPPAALAAIDETARLFVACSGGADSVYCLLLCHLYRRSRGAEAPRALHFDHRLRGAESAADRDFVAQLARGLGLAFSEGAARHDPSAGTANEGALRALRMSFFRRAVGEQAGAALVATGHHADDIVETMLMRLSRGAGLQGLCAPRTLSEAGGNLRFVRPLLGLSRAEIRSGLKAAGIVWREDASNEGEGNYRARIRGSVAPAWEAASDRPLRSGVTRSRALLEEDFAALEAMAAQAWETCRRSDSDGGLDREHLQGLPKALQRRLLQRMANELEAGGIELSRSVAEAALAALASGEDATFSLGEGARLALGRVAVTARRETPRPDWKGFRLPLGCVAYLPGGGRLAASRIVPDPAKRAEVLGGEGDDREGVYLALGEKQRGSVFVRRRQPGDAFKAHGKPSAKKLNTLFIDRKIPLEERERLPIVLADDGEIVWAPGLPPHGDWLLREDCETALRLTYQR